MINSPSDAEVDGSPAARLAQEIKRRRTGKRLSQPALAKLIGYSRQYVSLAERNVNLPSHDIVRAIDHALGAEGQLLALWRDAKSDQQARRAARLAPSEPVAPYDTSHQTGAEPVLHCPAGRYFPGSVTPLVTIAGANIHDRVLAHFEDQDFDARLRQPQRALVVATVDSSDGPVFYGMDRRRVRARRWVANADAPLLFPRAYKLDDLTLAIAWATTNLDDALLDDDAELHATVHRIGELRKQSRSSATTEVAGELSTVSQMWLGSDVCARHILRHTAELTQQPQFWAREQRGEEASTWLLFAHKYHYLQRTSPTTATAPIRAFCIPSDAVTDSTAHERILFLLTAALIESVGIRVAVCTEPEYTAVPGFVLDASRRAIVATWINTDQLWHVDITDHRPTIREFRDAAGWAHHHSILTGTTPIQRLRALADYLGLDWARLSARCAALADYGITGFITPRSRLLSVAGIERACRFLGDLTTDDR
ncbi:helix-turn-helix transcriptional regulator [Nocardia xishanensis]|uniref:helix-turn-helix transcriptional regulator n=1 Tax=Nocardia xishanensis TaxID=238964 RepID=UPI0033C25070